MRPATARICILSCITMAGLAQPPAQPPAQNPADQPTAIDHPSVGHPMVPQPTAEWPKAKAEDVSTVEAIVAAYYASTSGAVGQPRDWNRFRSLFQPEARLIPARPTADGGAGVFFLNPTQYMEQNQKYFEKSGFIDTEAAHRIESYENIAHVWSTYESRRASGASEPYSRGIASIQLLKDNGRWWIVSIFWDYERTSSPIPAKYKTTPKE